MFKGNVSMQDTHTQIMSSCKTLYFRKTCLLSLVGRHDLLKDMSSCLKNAFLLLLFSLFHIVEDMSISKTCLKYGTKTRFLQCTLQCMWNPIKLKHLGLCCCVWSIHPMGFLNIQTFEFTPSKHFCDSTFCEFPFFTSRQKNRLHFYTPCQVLVINLDKTSSMAKFSWSFVRWAMLQTVNWVILPNGMMQNTLQLIMPQVCHITCSAILPALTLPCFKQQHECKLASSPLYACLTNIDDFFTFRRNFWVFLFVFVN